MNSSSEVGLFVKNFANHCSKSDIKIFVKNDIITTYI